MLASPPIVIGPPGRNGYVPPNPIRPPHAFPPEPIRVPQAYHPGGAGPGLDGVSAHPGGVGWLPIGPYQPHTGAPAPKGGYYGGGGYSGGTKKMSLKGVAAPPSGIDPVADAVQSIGTISNYFTVVGSGNTPTSDQTAVAQQALQSIAQDIQQLQGRSPSPSTTPPAAGMSKKEVAAIAIGSAVVAGVAVYLYKK